MLQCVYAMAIPYIDRTSVTRVYCIKTAEAIIEILSLSDQGPGNIFLKFEVRILSHIGAISI